MQESYLFVDPELFWEGDRMYGDTYTLSSETEDIRIEGRKRRKTLLE